MAGRSRTRLAAAALGMTPAAYTAQAKAPYLEKKRGRPPKVEGAAPAPPKPKPVVEQSVDAEDARLGAALAAVAGNSPDMDVIFVELRKEAMKFALDVMKMQLDPDERSFNKLLSVKQQITTAVLTATTRVRPGDLREREDDGVARLLRALKDGAGEVTEADLLD